MKTVYIPLAKISIDGGTQARAEINAATVAEYAECLSEGDTLPPALVFFDGAKNHLTDGFHRFHANRQIGATSMECEVRTGTLLDARMFAYGANKGHGLPRTSADKRKAVTGALTDAPDWSDRAIAKHVGVGNQLVGDVRKAICVIHTDEAPTARTVERNGTTYTQDTAGQKKAGKEKATKPAAVEPKSPEPAPAAKAPADEYADMVEGDEPAADELTALRDALAAEGVAHLETLADNEAMAKVFEASEPLAAAMAENKQLRAEVASLRERVNGLLGEKNAAIRAAESWKRKAGKGGAA